MSVAKRLLELSADYDAPNMEYVATEIARVEKETGVVLAEEQRAAVAEALRCGVLIITGGPGTGKSVVAMTLLVDILRKFRENDKRRNVRFVSPTSSFRQAMISMLAGSHQDKKERKRRKDLAKNLFCGSMGFYMPEFNSDSAKESPYHCLICDEAHRLHSHQNMYRGKNQIEDIVKAACLTFDFLLSQPNPVHIFQVHHK